MLNARHPAAPYTYIIATRVMLPLCTVSEATLMVIVTQPLITWEKSLNEGLFALGWLSACLWEAALIKWISAGGSTTVGSTIP